MVVDTDLEQKQLATPTPQQSAVDLKQFVTILLRRRWLILGCSGVILAIGTVLALMAKPTYQSYMQIMVSSNLYQGVRSPYNQKDAERDFADPNFQVVDYTAQRQLMLSKKLIKKAVESLPAEYDLEVEDIKGKKGKTGPLAVERIEGGKGVNKVLSQVFEVSYKDDDPIKTQKVLQALQKVYQDYNIQQQEDRLNKGLGFVNSRLPEIKTSVVKAEKNLEAFRRKHNLLDPQVQGQILLESLADTQQQLEATRAQLQDVEARYRNLERKLAASPRNALVSSRLSESTRYQTLLNEIQKTELALAQERLRYTKDSPQVKNLEDKRKNQLALLEQEVGRTLGDKDLKTQSKTETETKTETKINTQTTLQNQISTNGLLSKGQMAGVDIKLVEELVQLHTTYLGLVANEQSLSQSAEKIRAELSRYPTLIAEYSRLLPEVETHRQTLEQLLQARQSLGLQIAQGGFDWQILEEPEEGIYLGSGRLMLLLGVLVIGPSLGIAAALIREQFNDAIYSTAEISKLTNLRLLGVIPKFLPRRKIKRFFNLSFKDGQIEDPAFAQTISSFPSHESLDMAFQNIQILKSPLPFKSLMITSALEGEGKSTIAMGLAMSAARMHKRVLLIDANLRNPNLHKALKISNNWGLSLLLEDEGDFQTQDYIQPVHPAIDVLTAGPVPEDSVKLLSSVRMKELMESFEDNYDLIILDTPQILGMVDARIIASYCKGIVMIARLGLVTRNELMQAKDIIDKLNLVGIIANQVPSSEIATNN